MARTKTADRDMTQGGIFRALLLFSLPLLAGNFFQQCYNTVDSIVLGNFVGKAALAAVGTTTPIINTLIGLFLGLSAGIGVVISQFYGAKEEELITSSRLITRAPRAARRNTQSLRMRRPKRARTIRASVG
uniref:MATE family efflux transporter n=1 Tax=Evtepia gabavorous TaxID=2211183 RepID=UPI003A932E63